MRLGERANHVHEGCPKGALEARGQGERPLSLRHRERVGGIFGDPDQKIEGDTQYAI